MGLIRSFPLLGIVLAACSTTGPPNELVGGSGPKVSFTVDVPSDVAYSRALRGTRACYFHPFVVESDYFPDTKAGRVSAGLPSMMSLSTAYVVEIAPAGTGSSVTVSHHPSATNVAATIRTWLTTGEYKDCRM